ncbi:MAG: glycosyltransferase family 1 protein [Verrucomicrobiota bacterium]
MLNRLALVTETFPPEVNGVAMTLNRLSQHLCLRGIDLQLVHPKPRATYNWGLKGDWESVHVYGFPIPGYPEAQIGMPSRGKLTKMWQQQRPDVVHVATEGLLGRSAVQAAMRLGIPLVTSFHTNFHEYTRHYHLAWMKSLVIRYLRGIHGKALVNLVPDPDLIEELHRLGFRGGEYFGRGVDTQLFHSGRRRADLRSSWGAGEDTTVFLHVSRVAAEKNMPLVLDTYRTFCKEQNSDAKCVVVGDGPERSSLEKRYPEVIFSGMKFDEELAAHYASADLFCFASETETFGNVVTEAMASGCPVVTYDYAAGRQHIVSGKNGITVPLADHAAFARAMVELAQKPELQQKLGQAARDTAETIPWEGVISEYLRVINRVVAQN